MGRYTHDPTSVVAAIPIFPKDDYELKIGKPKPFERTARKGHQSYGIRFPMTAVGGMMDGKRTVFTIYLHSEGAQQMAKRFQMAVYGLKVNERNEKEFDQWAHDKDWTYDPESGELGEAWAEYEGKHVMVDLDIDLARDEVGQPLKDAEGNETQQQTWGTWRPVAAVEAAV